MMTEQLFCITQHNLSSTQYQINPLLFRTKGTSDGAGVIIALFYYLSVIQNRFWTASQ